MVFSQNTTNLSHDNAKPRWVALMIQLEKCVGGGVAYTKYLYPARWGWINRICRSTEKEKYRCPKNIYQENGN